MLKTASVTGNLSPASQKQLNEDIPHEDMGSSSVLSEEFDMFIEEQHDIELVACISIAEPSPLKLKTMQFNNAGTINPAMKAISKMIAEK